MAGNYTYEGHARWDGGLFESPNQFAVVLLMVLPFLLAGWWYGRRFSTGKKLLWSGTCTILAVVATYALAHTYSRGGHIAYGAALVTLICFGSWRPAIWGGVLFFLCLLLTSHGVERLAGSINIESDASIANRISIWKAALAITADNPINGVGYYDIGEEYRRFYQPLNIDENYLTAVSNYLTISAGLGLPILAVYVFFLCTPVWLAWQLARRRPRNVLLPAASAALVGFLVAGIFSHFHHILSITIPLCGLVVLLWSIWAVGLWSRLSNDPFKSKCFFIAQNLKTPAVKTCLFVGGIWLVSIAARESYEVTGQELPITPLLKQAGLTEIFHARPRNSESKGLVLYLSRKDASLDTESWRTIRPLARYNFKVYGMALDEGGYPALDKAQAFLKYAVDNWRTDNEPVYLLGEKEGGRMWFLASTRQSKEDGIAALALASIAPDWPFDDLSPMKSAEAFSSPLLLAYLGRKEALPHGDVQLLLDRLEENNIPVSYLRLESPDIGADNWGRFVEEAARLFSMQQ